MRPPVVRRLLLHYLLHGFVTLRSGLVMVKRQPDRARLRPLVALPPRPFSALPLVRRGPAEFCCLAADATSGCSVSTTALPLARLRHSALRVGVYSCITSCTVLSPSILFRMSPEPQDLAHS